MATMVKEKRRQKKRTKETHTLTRNANELREELDSLSVVDDCCSSSIAEESYEKLEADEKSDAIGISRKEDCTKEINILTSSTEGKNDFLLVSPTPISAETDIDSDALMKHDHIASNNAAKQTGILKSDDEGKYQLNYKYLNVVLETIKDCAVENEAGNELPNKCTLNMLTPSAPVFEEELKSVQCKEIIAERQKRARKKCMLLEEAIWLYGGTEIAEVRAISEREELIVEAGHSSNSEHPLVDLLSTFRSSLLAVEHERIEIACKLVEEQKFRTALWKIENHTVSDSEKCLCGEYVMFRAKYDHAEFFKDKLPAARMRLEALLRDVQESYCHHQHAALMAYCQIEEVVSETLKANKEEIREALSLVLQALRTSGTTSGALASALLRWAKMLTSVLLDGRDLSQLLFLLHHLFRQTRSVRWATRLINVSIGDRVEAARAITLLDLILAASRLNSAVECTEETDDLWEEVDQHGSGAVREGEMRERDLLALLHALPLRDLVARMVLFTHRDVSAARVQDWGDSSGGRGVLKAACGARALLATLRRATLSHPQYERLHRRIHTLAVTTLHALAALHLHTRASYLKSLEEKIATELEASFVAGLNLLNTSRLHELPTTLLQDDTAKEYCLALITTLHEPKSVINSLSTETLEMCCGDRVLCVTQASVLRDEDYELARAMLDFLFQTGIRKKPVACKGRCEDTARRCLPQLVAAHPHLHALALRMVADVYAVENLDASSLDPLSIGTWRAGSGELRLLLEDWARRCPALLPHLLLRLDCTPHSGLSLDSQLVVGTWLCQYVRTLPGDPPEWAWQALRTLRVHRTGWDYPLEAPAPEEDPIDVFSSAYAVLSSSWGHSIPLICEQGVSALCHVAAARPSDAAHCLAPVMLVMAQSPDSLSFTPKFPELFCLLLGSGPTLVQRAFGRGGVAGHTLLLNLILTQLGEYHRAGVPRSSLLSAWLHVLWRPTLPAAALSMLDCAMVACRDWAQLDAHAAVLVHAENSKEYISHCVRNASVAPLLCESVLRVAHAQREVNTLLFPQLLLSLQNQQRHGKKIHVDNALKQIDPRVTSEDLIIYRTVIAAMVAPLQHPSHLMLWRLFFHLYLQRPLAHNKQDPVAPAGPLLFSGIVKSRTLAQIKKRLQETAAYHHDEAEKLKTGQESQSPKPQLSNNKTVKAGSNNDDSLLPTLTMANFVGESNDTDSSDGSSLSDDEEIHEIEDAAIGVELKVKKEDIGQLINYHIAAEKLVRDYLCWAEAGERVCAEPHQADLARYIPEQALSAAWNHEWYRYKPAPDESPVPCIPPPAQRKTPFNNAIDNLMKIKNRSFRRSRRFSIRSLIENINFKDPKVVLIEVDNHLKNIEALAQEWNSETSRISSLDTHLLQLVSKLRVSRPIPPITKYCSKKCKPIVVTLPYREWCLSIGVEQGISENRASARQELRRLARARPDAARSAAALYAIARRVDGALAARIVERAWTAAGRAGRCAPAHLALTQLVDYLAERWICSDSAVCSDLLSRWARVCDASPLQQALCGALVAPRRLPPHNWPQLYRTLLRSNLPSHAVFSYLSKFELGWWAERCEPGQRREILEALLVAAQRWGSEPNAQHHVLLELIGVHSRTLVNSHELAPLVCGCARASSVRRLPAQHWPHVVRAAANTAHQVPFDQLGHLLRDVGVIWWEARTAKGRTGRDAQYAAYAPHIASLLHVLLRAFVAAALSLTYEPEKVGWFAWSAAQESWCPWVAPVPAALPLLSCTGKDDYTPMLRHFVDTLQQLMADCPGSENQLLLLLWEWTIQTYLTANASGCQESQLQCSTLLAELTKLPWTEHQWFHASCLQSSLQVCTSGDEELRMWCGGTVCGNAGATWVRGVPDAQLAPHLAAILALLTKLPLPNETLEQATTLPWSRLPEPALQTELERYFVEHHDPTLPYHALPHFRLVLAASELCGTSPHGTATAQAKRACGVSLWTRAAAAPTLLPLVPAHQARLLETIAQLELEDGLEELLGRALVILCIEPAAAAALPVWERWASSCPTAALRSLVRALAVLTAPRYFAPLADRSARALLEKPEPYGWPDVSGAWRVCPWSDPGALARGACLHAAYGAALAHGGYEPALQALVDTDVNFVKDEVISCVWVCAAGRVGGDGGSALVSRWGEEPRRSLLRLVAMHTDRGPTARIRLLSRLAQCILTPGSESAMRAYETTCAALLGSNPGEVANWGRSPHPRGLPRLAVKLFPKHEKYFSEEIKMTPEEN